MPICRQRMILPVDNEHSTTAELNQDRVSRQVLRLIVFKRTDFVCGFVTVITLAGATLSSCQPARRDIGTSRKSFNVYDDGATVVAEGSWHRLTGQRSVLIPKVNTVRVECWRQIGYCEEYIAKLITPEDSPDVEIEGTVLFLMKEQYPIVEWTDTTIVARAGPRAADIELRLSLVDKSLERTSRETGARGAEGANPTAVEHWILK